MINILLMCAGGFSSSLLMQRTQAAADQTKYEFKVNAVAYDQNCPLIKTADVVLLGPQVRFHLDEFKRLFPDKPVDVISMPAYGACDGVAVFKQAVSVYKASKQ